MELTPPILDRFTSDLVQSKATTQENTNRQLKKILYKCDKRAFFLGYGHNPKRIVLYKRKVSLKEITFL